MIRRGGGAYAATTRTTTRSRARCRPDFGLFQNRIRNNALDWNHLIVNRQGVLNAFKFLGLSFDRDLA